MQLADASSTLRLIWQYKPESVWLLGVGIAVFIFVVVDTWLHKRRRRRKQPRERR